MGSLREPSRQGPVSSDARLSVDLRQQLATLDGDPLTLTRKEYDLLALLVQHAGMTVPREILLKQIWGYGSEIRTRTLDVHIRRLRMKLGTYAEHYIETVFGIGYRFYPFRD